MNNKNTFTIVPLAVFLILFYLTDTLRLYFQYNTGFHLDRLFTWIIPISLYIIFVLKKKPINYLKLCPEIKRGVFWGSLISIAHIAIYCFVRYHWNQQLTINFNIPFQTYWNKILVAGFVEEIMFRGLVLQNLNKVFSFKTSNIASATLFLLAHVPYWYFGNQFSLPLSTIMYDFGFILAFGLLQGFLLKKTNSLWTCIIHHSVNNALALIVR